VRVKETKNNVNADTPLVREYSKEQQP